MACRRKSILNPECRSSVEVKSYDPITLCWDHEDSIALVGVADTCEFPLLFVGGPRGGGP